MPKIGDFGLAKKFHYGGALQHDHEWFRRGNLVLYAERAIAQFSILCLRNRWSLGAIAYEALTARVPRPITKGQSPVEVILHTSVQPVESVANDIPQPLAAFLNRCLTDDLEVRFRDAARMREALAKVAEELRIPLA